MPSGVMLVCFCRTENMPSVKERPKCVTAARRPGLLESELRPDGRSTRPFHAAVPRSGFSAEVRRRPQVAAASLAAFFFLDFFDAFAPLAPDAASAVVAAVGVLAAASALAFLPFLPLAVDAASAVAAGVTAGVVAVVAAGDVAAVAAADDFTVDLAGAAAPALVAAGVLLAFVPVGGADEPPNVSPACSRFVTDFVPRPLTRLARSSASLNGPFFVRSSMIAFDFTGPSPFTASSEVWSAVFTSTAANAAPMDNARARHSINSFLSMTSAPG